MRVPPAAWRRPYPARSCSGSGAGRLAGDVPQRHVDGADAERDEAAMAVPVGRATEPVPDAGDVARVRAHHERRQATLDDKSDGQGGFLATGDGLTPADQSIIGLDPNECQVADLAIIVRLRVANGR